jgi:tetratricopeptide (TPR) repeat protein
MNELLESEEAQLKRLYQALKLDLSNVEAHIQIGVLLFEHFHRDRDAINHFTKALKLDPQNVDALFWLAVCHNLCFCEYSKAKDALDKALKLDPNRPDCLSLMATAVWECDHDLDQAMFYVKRSLELAPDWPSLYHQLARLLLEKNQVEEAEKIAKKGIQYRNSLSQFGNDTERYFELVITGRAASDVDEGWEYLMNDIEEAKQKKSLST